MSAPTPVLAARPSRKKAAGRRRSLGRAVAPVIVLLSFAGIVAASVRFAPPVLDEMAHHPYFGVTQIVLRGTRALERDSVLGAADLRVGMSIWNVDPAAIEEQVQALAWVRQASVRREFPNRVIISIRERQPEAIVLVEGLQYIDRTGRILGPVRTGASTDLPFITGLRGQHLQGPGVPALRRALRFARLCEKRHCGGGVSEVHLDPTHGLVLVPREAPVSVIVGWGHWNGKIDRMERVLAAWEGREGRIRAIDVTLRRTVVVKLREGGEGAPAAKAKSGGTPI